MPKITALGNAGIIWLLWAVVLIFIKRYRKYGIILFIALLAGLIIGNGILKNIVERPRPCWLDESVVLLIQNPKDFSFPSGHTLSSVIAAVVLTAANKKFGIAAIPIACLIAFSRMYLYVHFPSDVITSVILGIIIALVILKLLANRKWINNLQNKKKASGF